MPPGLLNSRATQEERQVLPWSFGRLWSQTMERILAPHMNLGKSPDIRWSPALQCSRDSLTLEDSVVEVNQTPQQASLLAGSAAPPPRSKGFTSLVQPELLQA